MASLENESDQRRKTLSQKFLSHENRRFTDPVGAFIYSFIAFFICLGLLIKYSNHYQEDTDSCPYSTPASESWNSSQNVSNNVIYNTSELADSINYMLKTEQLISGVSVWQLGYIARSLFGLYIFKQIINLLIKIPYEAVSLAEFYVHILIINVVRPTITLIFFVVLHFQSTEAWISFQHENYKSLCIEPFILPLIFAFILLGFYIYVETPKKQSIRSNIKSTIRFYIKIRNLLLFRFLILTGMQLVIICLIIMAKYIRSCHFLADKGIIIITCLLLFSFHTYGEMIIMTATAERNCDQNEKVVSFKTLLNAIVIVTKNHLGSIFLDTLLKITSILNIPIEKWYGYEPSIDDHVVYLTTYSKAYTRKLSIMFTAALGQSHFYENMKSIEYFRKQGRPQLVPENKSNVAFVVILKWSAIWTFICWFWEEGSASSLTIMMVIFLNFSVMSVVLYMTTAIDTIDSMIQFGKIDVDEKCEEKSNRNSWEENDHSDHDV